MKDTNKNLYEGIDPARIARLVSLYGTGRTNQMLQSPEARRYAKADFSSFCGYFIMPWDQTHEDIWDKINSANKNRGLFRKIVDEIGFFFGFSYRLK